MNLPCHVHNIYITLYYINAEIKFYLDLSWRAYNRETNTLWGKVSRVTLDFYIEVWIHNEHSFFRHWATRSHHLWSNWVTGNIPSCTVKRIGSAFKIGQTVTNTVWGLPKNLATLTTHFHTDGGRSSNLNFTFKIQPNMQFFARVFTYCFFWQNFKQNPWSSKLALC